MTEEKKPLSRSEREAQQRKNAFAADVIKTSPGLKRLRKRWRGIDRAEQERNWEG